MKKITDLLQGKKSYIISILTAIFAIAGYITGNLTTEQAITLLLGAGGLSSLRAAK